LQGEKFLQRDSNQWLTDGREKYIWHSQSGREPLFDLEEDPTELHDLAAARPQRVAFWRERLIAELDGREEGLFRTGAGERHAAEPHAGRRGALSGALNKWLVVGH